ncbi:unnamed protein product [Camellia sinensis]
MGSKMAREGVPSAFEYLLKGRKVKLNANQRKGFDPKIVADKLLKRWSITIVESKEDKSTVDMKVQRYTIPYRWPLKNLSVVFHLSSQDIMQLGAQAEKKGKEIAEIEEDIGLNKYLKIISTMVI